MSKSHTTIFSSLTLTEYSLAKTASWHLLPERESRPYAGRGKLHGRYHVHLFRLLSSWTQPALSWALSELKGQVAGPPSDFRLQRAILQTLPRYSYRMHPFIYFIYAAFSEQLIYSIHPAWPWGYSNERVFYSFNKWVSTLCQSNTRNKIVMEKICEICPKVSPMVEIDIYHIFTKTLGEGEKYGKREHSRQRELQVQRHWCWRGNGAIQNIKATVTGAQWARGKLFQDVAGHNWQ